MAEPGGVDYEGRVFASIANTANGDVGDETVFHYHQDGDLVWADYAGGSVLKGHLLGTVGADGALTFTYHHVRDDGRQMTGECRSTLTVLEDGRYRLDEDWRWTSGDGSRGRSTIEEKR
jgi:hypothetical protein